MKSDLLDQARGLDLADRIDLVEAIWDTVDERIGVDDLAVPEAHRLELDRRLDVLEPDTAMPWNEVRARLQQER